VVDYKLPNSNRTIRSTITTDRHDIYDTVNENMNKALNEIAKFQPQYLQSISNLQLDCIQTVKNLMQNMISVQKQMVDINNNNNNGRWNIPTSPVPIQYIEQFTRQLNEFTNNTIRISNLNSQFTITIIDTIRENLNIYNRATDELSKYNTNMAKAWNSFFANSH
jgi:DNA polymerase III delta prime subunit